MTPLQSFADRVSRNIERVILGKSAQIELLLVALLCQGHVLIEDVPGTGKTMLARALATSLGLRFNRLQCTPDLLPTDITGVTVFQPSSGQFEFRPGPLFVNVLLADELNRATPRTQSALLEAMQEQQVTVDGRTHPLPPPFIVLATQNPIEYEGTFPLPEAQLDRFFMRLALGYPSEEAERALLRAQREGHPIEQIGQVVDGREVLALARSVGEIHVDETVERYLLALVRATRDHPDLLLGASPRGSLALYRGAQALAALRGRDHVLPDDVKALAPVTLTHRLLVRPESELRGRSAGAIVAEILGRTALELGEPG